MASGARTSATGAHRAARLCIQLTLFTLNLILTRSINFAVTVSLNASSLRRAGFAFVCFYGTLVSTENMMEVKITDDIKVGGNNPCFIIAEVGQNHQGDIEIAKQLIKAAKVSTNYRNFSNSYLRLYSWFCLRCSLMLGIK